MKSISLSVTKNHIDQAVRADSHRCMIADAVAKHIPNAHFIMVDLQSIRFSDTKLGRRYIYMTPPSAQNALLRFDEGKKVKPFSMTLKTGFSRLMRVRTPGYKPSKHKYPKNRNSPRFMPSRYRKFGIRQIVKQ